jgi:hypothetical protein
MEIRDTSTNRPIIDKGGIERPSSTRRVSPVKRTCLGYKGHKCNVVLVETDNTITLRCQSCYTKFTELQIAERRAKNSVKNGGNKPGVIAIM